MMWKQSVKVLGLLLGANVEAIILVVGSLQIAKYLDRQFAQAHVQWTPSVWGLQLL